MSIGFRILPMPQPLEPGVADELRRCATAHLADSVGYVQAAGSALAARHRSRVTLCGCAITVRAAPGDNLLVQKALDMARPGDVLVVDGGGDAGRALVGGVMAALARRRGVAGFVVCGAVRDLDDIAEGSLPVYSTGVSPRGPSRAGPGEINVAVTVAGMVVQPGDIVIGDLDGVLAIPRRDVARVLAGAREIQKNEDAALRAMDLGELDRSWINAALRAGGCDYPEG